MSVQQANYYVNAAFRRIRARRDQAIHESLVIDDAIVLIKCSWAHQGHTFEASRFVSWPELEQASFDPLEVLHAQALEEILEIRSQ